MRRAAMVLVAAALLLHSARADAFNYSLVANAGGDGDSTSDVSVDSVTAEYLNEGSLSYEAYSAFASGTGALSASAASAGIPPFASISHSASARIEETIRLGPPHPFPNGPVTVTAGIAAGLTRTSNGTIAKAFGQVQIEPFSETCVAGTSTDGPASGSCPAGSVDGGTVTRTFTLQELGNRNYEIDVAAQVSATLELFASDGDGSASASGALWVQVSGGGVTDYFWSGTNTSIPVPEPTPQTLGAAALLVLAARRNVVRES